MPDYWDKKFEENCKNIFTPKFRIGLLLEMKAMDEKEELEHQEFIKEVNKIKQCQTSAKSQ